MTRVRFSDVNRLATHSWARSPQPWSSTMKFAIPLCAMTRLGASVAQAQVELKTYEDANGTLDVQNLARAQWPIRT